MDLNLSFHGKYWLSLCVLSELAILREDADNTSSLSRVPICITSFEQKELWTVGFPKAKDFILGWNVT